MDHETVFLMGVYLLPLGFVSLISAWAGNRTPWLALVLAVLSVAFFGYVFATRPEGLFSIRDIPDLTIALVVRVIALFQ